MSARVRTQVASLMVLTLLILSLAVANAPLKARAGGDYPLPNVTWSFKDSISACPAGDSVFAGRPSRLRILVTYFDADEQAKSNVPPESIWVTCAAAGGNNARANDIGSAYYAGDSTKSGSTRIIIPSLSGTGNLNVTLYVSGVSQGTKVAHIRTTDPDASGRDSAGTDQSTPGDIDWSGGVTQADIDTAAAHINHWRRNLAKEPGDARIPHLEGTRHRWNTHTADVHRRAR